MRPPPDLAAAAARPVARPPALTLAAAPRSLSYFAGFLPKYFSSEWSYAQFRAPDSRSVVAFGQEPNTIIGAPRPGRPATRRPPALSSALARLRAPSPRARPTLAVIGSDGCFYKASFARPGDCERKEYHRFITGPEEEASAGSGAASGSPA